MILPALQKLAQLLRERVVIIADHAWRERDSAAHLAALQRVSESIDEEAGRLATQLPPRLRHFLQQASYQKALAFIEDPVVD